MAIIYISIEIEVYTLYSPFSLCIVTTKESCTSSKLTSPVPSVKNVNFFSPVAQDLPPLSNKTRISASGDTQGSIVLGTIILWTAKVKYRKIFFENQLL